MKRLLSALALTGRLWAAPPQASAAFSRAEEAFFAEKYALSRQLTEQILKDEPNNFAALFLLGRIYHYGEGSIPRAYYCYSKACKEIERAYPNPEHSESSKLYGLVIDEFSGVAQQLEHYQEACDLVDKYDRLFPSTKITVNKGWPLLKLGRFAEARQLMLRWVDDPAQAAHRRHALNTLGTLEFETDGLQKSYDYYAQIVAEISDPTDVDPVYWSNAGGAALDLQRFDLCEKLLLESTKHFNPYTYSDPWGSLAEIYSSQGRMAEALEALKNMQAWRLSGSAKVSQNKWAGCYGSVGLVLLQMGYDEESLAIIERLVHRQDRNSGSSAGPALVEARLVFLYTLALQRNTQRLREKLSYCSWNEVPGHLIGLLQMERQLLRQRQRVANLVASNAGIERFVLPFGARTQGQPSLSPALWTCFGPGATIATVERILAENKPETQSRSPYLLAVLGEAYQHDWKNPQAQKALQDALARLPAAEVKLRNRCQAVLARALNEQGKGSQALPYLQTLMDSDPSQLRACQVALPIRIESDGGRAANQARDWLYQSPRCQQSQGAFVLKLQGDSQQVEGQLFSPDGTLAGRFKGQPRGNGADAARSFCAVFHAEAFAPIIDLTQSDIRSIDGSTGVARPNALKDLAK